MSKLSISLGQMRIQLGQTKANFATAAQLMAESAAAGAELLVLPELWSTGYDLAHARHHADCLGTGMFAQVAEGARRHSLAIYGSLLEQQGDDVLNCASYHDARGELCAVYRKLHLFRLFDEHKWLAQGQGLASASRPWGSAGLSICYDLRFPEVFRQYAVEQGVQLLLICAEWPHARIAHWRALLHARAIENQCFVVAVNACGDTGGTTFGGHSMIVDPWGQTVLEAGTEEALLIAEIDLAAVAQVRQQIPVFADRRPDVYRLD